VPRGSELNQVWTSIIGNPIGAVGGPARVLARRRDSGGIRSRHRLILPDCRAPFVPDPQAR
jgi:hypothetical protein